MQRKYSILITVCFVLLSLSACSGVGRGLNAKVHIIRLAHNFLVKKGVRAGMNITKVSIAKSGNTNYKIFQYMNDADHATLLAYFYKPESGIRRSWVSRRNKRIFYVKMSAMYNPMHVAGNPDSTFKGENALCRDARVSTINKGKKIESIVTACKSKAGALIYR